MTPINYVKEKQAFDGTTVGYRFQAWYLTEPKGEALVQISKDGVNVREFLWPAYKVWNIPAHASDIVEGLERESNDGLRTAGEVGFGANVFQE